MFTGPEGNIIIRMIIEMPWAPAPIEKRIELSRHTFECLQPLNRDRDLGHMFGEVYWRALEEARKQTQERYEKLEYVSRKLRDVLVEAVESRDPQRGYSPEEWAQIHGGKK